MRQIVFVLTFIMCLALSACVGKEKKPFGAENIDYDKVEGINKEGPVLNVEHPENLPPMADKVIVENGPWATKESIKVEPTADIDEFADDGGVPIYEPEHKD